MNYVSTGFALAVSLPWLWPLLPLASAQEYSLHRFERQQLTDTYFSEGAGVGDINGDGVPDVVYGPHWYEGPDFQTAHEIYPAVPQDRNRYADHFFAWVHDFNRDGWKDVLVVGFPGTPAYIYENPKAEPLDQPWPKHEVLDWVSNESPQFVNLVGDEQPELVCTRDGFFGFATYDRDAPFSTWKFHPISLQVTAKKFGHGLGIGDINGDGRSDIIHSGGWYEQPESEAASTRWLDHEVKLCDGPGGAEMYAYDVDGDGDNDVITSDAAHTFGLSWFEQTELKGQIAFKHHRIMGARNADNNYGVCFSEPHSVALADIDGDGLKDIITGKTYWSHHRKSPLWDAGAVVYWFKLVRGKDGVDWVPYQADADCGIGRQIVIADVSGDDRPDIIVGGMKGAHVLRHHAESVSREQYDAVQPRPYTAAESNDLADTGKRVRGPKPQKTKKATAILGKIEGESLNATVTAGQARTQNMSNFRSDSWSNKKHLWWTGGGRGDTLTLPLPPFTGVVDVDLVLTCAKDYGVVQISLDDQLLGEPIDLYEPEVVTTGILSFPKLSVTGKQHALKVKLIGANPSAVPSLMFAIDWLRIRTSDGTYATAKPSAGPDVAANTSIAGERRQDQTARIKASTQTLRPDEYPHAGLRSEQAAAAMRVPDGFEVIVGASEPDVKQPIAMTIDDRGRVWVAEAYEYPIRADGDEGRDRILIFEDLDGDGSLETRKVFYEGLNLVSGMEVGFGGVWVGAAPYLMFIPDRNGDDQPDSEPEILLDGWGYQDTHETLNAFIWGPDGWLYGCHGVFTHSKVGKPGTPEEQRTPINCGVWRYHPTKHNFEVFAHGTSNPWGVDFDDHGEAFITACVIPHLYHIIQGARYQRQGGRHFNPHTYRDLATIADHLHYLGATPHSGNSKSDSAGGGHAHSGAMIYLGDRWPDHYRGQLLMNNIHGQRLNVDVLKPQGSGYVGSHGPDFLLTGDQASQILNLRYGPDGNAWMIDWYDMQACHRRDAEVHDRSNGRIYKICFGPSETSSPAINLAEAADLALAELCLHPNDWYVRHSRRVLQQRAAVGKIADDAIERLRGIALVHPEETRRLRAVWALHVVGAANADLIGQLLRDDGEYVRRWAIQLAMEFSGEDGGDHWTSQWVSMAESDVSPVVRLALASAAQRLPAASRWELLESLLQHAEDATDHNLPLMYWYAAEPLAEVDPDRALAMAMSPRQRIPLVRQFMLRRIGSGSGAEPLAVLVGRLAETDDVHNQLAYLQAIRSVLSGRRQVDPPPAWLQASTRLFASDHVQVRLQAIALGVTFGDSRAFQVMSRQITDNALPVEQRALSLQSMLDAGQPQLVPALVSLVAEGAEDASNEDLVQTAIAGMAQYEDDRIAPALLDRYDQLSPPAKRLALATLSARPNSAQSLLQAIKEKRIAGTDLSADLVRQMQFLGNTEVDQLLQTVWGVARHSPADKLALIEQYKRDVASDDHPRPDLQLGRAVFAKTCMNCHVLYGAGRKVGPDLTGSNRSNLDYLLSNIVDPSAVMAKEYIPTIVLMDDGRVVNGLVKEETEYALTLQTADAVVVVPKNEIETRSEGEQSMMPEDQLKQFSPHQIRSLIAYLRSKQQVPILASAQNAMALFNGTDLNGWLGAPDLWSVEDGEIVGRTAGLKRNQWLVSDLSVQDFRFSVDVKLVDNAGNSGIQFRSAGRPDEVSGYQADIGAGWWGKLYEEHGRKLLWDEPGEQYVKPGDWNRYQIVAKGNHIQTSINGQTCVDLEDPEGARRGVIALQLHSGGKTEVRFKNFQLEILQ